mgnify:CR=1 FL=1
MNKKGKIGKFDWDFPYVKNVPPMTLSSQIKGMTAEEVREAMGKMFEDIQKTTGREIVVVGNTLPTRVFTPTEDKKTGVKKIINKILAFFKNM